MKPVCKYFLKDRCWHVESCRFSHPPYANKRCEFFAQNALSCDGKCNKWHISDPDGNWPCEAYIKGFCKDGLSCMFLHCLETLQLPDHLREKVKKDEVLRIEYDDRKEFEGNMLVYNKTPKLSLSTIIISKLVLFDFGIYQRGIIGVLLDYLAPFDVDKSINGIALVVQDGDKKNTSITYDNYIGIGALNKCKRCLNNENPEYLYFGFRSIEVYDYKDGESIIRTQNKSNTEGKKIIRESNKVVCIICAECLFSQRKDSVPKQIIPWSKKIGKRLPDTKRAVYYDRRLVTDLLKSTETKFEWSNGMPIPETIEQCLSLMSMPGWRFVRMDIAEKRFNLRESVSEDNYLDEYISELEMTWKK